MESKSLQKRTVPKLMACMTKGSWENFREKALFNLNLLDERAIRRRKLPLYQCLELELTETGFIESATYLSEILRDNNEFLAEDEIGIVVDLKKNDEFLEYVAMGILNAEKEKDKGNTNRECLYFLEMAMYFAEKGKGILWLAEKLFVTSIAIARQYKIDGGRQCACCKYHYAKFLLDKFGITNADEAFEILTEVRDVSIGKNWPLYAEEDEDDSETVFRVTAIELHRVYLDKARLIRKDDPAKAETLSRLAERRAVDAEDQSKVAEAILEMGLSQLQMNSLQNALKTFMKALSKQIECGNILGICDARMHLATAMQRLGKFDDAEKTLTEMGALAMEHGYRRQLGRALHLLGELHLRREQPELGTEYLKEAFGCFMGFNWQQLMNKKKESPGEDEDPALDEVYKNEREIYLQEAEQSRLMMAVSSGQEHMASYFNLLNEANTCTVAQVKAIDWKLANTGWWVERMYFDFIPCLCAVHNRTPLDVLRKQQEMLLPHDSVSSAALLDKAGTVSDIRNLRSSLHRSKFIKDI